MANELAKKENLKNINFLVSPAEENPFPDHSFDVVTASQCFVYFVLKRWIPEVKRILKPGGKFVKVFFQWLPLHAKRPTRLGGAAGSA